MRQHTNLLETIRDIAGCEYMSDLREPGRLSNARIAAALEKIGHSDYSVDEWSEACAYISGAVCHFESSKEAVNFLIERCGRRQEK